MNVFRRAAVAVQPDRPRFHRVHWTRRGDSGGTTEAIARVQPAPTAGDRVAKWKQHVMDDRGCADAAREAAAKKDAAAGKAAMTSRAKRCKECHADHRKEE